MPQWFAEANEALALAHAVKSGLAGLLGELKSGKISEDEFEKAYSAVFSKLLTGQGLKKITRLESDLLEQKAKLATVIRSTKDRDANVVLGFESRTIESLLNHIRSSKESLRRAVAQIELGSFSEKTKRLLSFIPTF